MDAEFFTLNSSLIYRISKFQFQKLNKPQYPKLSKSIKYNTWFKTKIVRSHSLGFFAFRLFRVWITRGKNKPNNKNGVYEDALINLEL